MSAQIFPVFDSWKFISFLVCLVSVGFVFSHLERKLTADIQARIGPTHLLSGFGQTFLDAIKLIQKKRLLQNEWFLWKIMAILACGLALLAWPTSQERTQSFSILICFSSIVVFLLATVLLKLEETSLPSVQSNLAPERSSDEDQAYSKTDIEDNVLIRGHVRELLFTQNEERSSFASSSSSQQLKSISSLDVSYFGTLRLIYQILIGMLPSFLALLAVGVRSHGFSWHAILSHQGMMPWHWNVFSDPFLAGSAFIYFVSGLTMLGLPPFEGGFGARDVYGRIGTGLVGMDLTLFSSLRFCATFLWSFLGVSCFLAGGVGLQLSDLFLNDVSFFALTSLKALGLMILAVWIGRSSPRMRPDWIHCFLTGWLVPVALFCLMGCLWFEKGGSPS